MSDVRFCINCNQKVQPKKHFSVGKFIGLFIVGMVLAFPFGLFMTVMETPYAIVVADRDDTEVGRQFFIDTATYIGSFLFILPWGAYILHYWTKSKQCPLCGMQEWADNTTHTSSIITPQTHTNTKKNTKTPAVITPIIIGVIAGFAIQLVLPFPYGLGAFVAIMCAVGYIIQRNLKRQRKDNDV